MFDPDSRGECDGCHLPWDKDLMTDHEEPGEFQFCRDCWIKINRKRNPPKRQKASRFTRFAGDSRDWR